MELNPISLFQGYLGLEKTSIQQDITFSNDTGTIILFTVTGDVIVWVLPVVTTDLASASSSDIRLGVLGNTDAMIVDSMATDFDARQLWFRQHPNSEIEPLDAVRSYIVTDGNDIVLTLSDQVDSGAMRFYCYWAPLSSDGNVVAA
jgi:hypothetical protein